MTSKTIMKICGLSTDRRTNRWRVTCPVCKKVFSPITTRLAHQVFNCPASKCDAELFADYNAEPPTCSVVGSPSEIDNEKSEG